VLEEKHFVVRSLHGALHVEIGFVETGVFEGYGGKEVVEVGALFEYALLVEVVDELVGALLVLRLFW